MCWLAVWSFSPWNLLRSSSSCFRTSSTLCSCSVRVFSLSPLRCWRSPSSCPASSSASALARATSSSRRCFLAEKAFSAPWARRSAARRSASARAASARTCSISERSAASVSVRTRCCALTSSSEARAAAASRTAVSSSAFASRSSLSRAPSFSCTAWQVPLWADTSSRASATADRLPSSCLFASASSSTWCSPWATTSAWRSSWCLAVACTALCASATRRTAACTAAFPARDRATAGTCSIMPPSFLQISSTELAAASFSLSSQSCHALRASMSCWSARRVFWTHTSFSSLPRASFSSCQYSRRTVSSPTARSSHCTFSCRRWSLMTARRASSVIGSRAPPGTGSPAERACRTFVALSRSSSVSPPQDVCCTVSQAPFMFRTLSSFTAATSWRASATKAKQPRGWPPTDFRFARHVEISWARSASTPARNSGFSRA
mmetsp:Transcript_102438/g.221125  ORF Transcript_102438/g.221125 Transcript_102438/m.221125 type:complete len:437 (+) Transcript_102438:467-1777(+)